MLFNPRLVCMLHYQLAEMSVKMNYDPMLATECSYTSATFALRLTMKNYNKKYKYSIYMYILKNKSIGI